MIRDPRETAQEWIVSNRGWVVSALTAAAIVVPQQLAHESRDATESSQPAWWDSVWDMEDARAPTADPLPSARHYELSGNSPARVMPSGLAPRPMMPQRSLVEIFRFDITAESVMQNWSQVWTRFGDDGLSGLRVTLMSGTRPTDLAGSLTYYFDRKHVLQRIAFSGSCGDPSELIVHLQQSYQLQPVPALGGYQYVARGADGQPVSGLEIRYAPVIQQDQPYRRLELELELNRPQGPGGLSERFRESFERSSSDSAPDETASEQPVVHDASPAGNPKDATPSKPRSGPRGRPADELLPHSR